MNLFLNFYKIMQKKKNLDIIERKILINTKDYIKELTTDEYHRTIRVPNVDEQYTNISLLSASISNSFPTIQKDINDKYKIIAKGKTFQLQMQTGEILEEESFISDNTFNIPLGYYSEDEILTLINDNFDKLTNTTHRIILGTDDNDPSQILSINRQKKLQLDYKINYIYKYSEMQDPQKYVWIEDINIELPENIYKLFGAEQSNENINIWNKPFPHSVQSSEIGGATSEDLLYKFPCRPTLISCSQLQIRFDTVNQEEDSNVLAYIPIEKFSEPYIVFINPNPKLTARRIGYHQNDLIRVSLSQEDGYGIELNEVIMILEVLIF